MTTKVEESIQVDVPVRTAYDQWTQFEDFPQFMGGITSVTQLGDDRLEWVAEIAGVRRRLVRGATMGTLVTQGARARGRRGSGR